MSEVQVYKGQMVEPEAIRNLQAVVGAMPQLGEELFHHFADGLYAREMRIPQGAIIVGKQHRYPCINFIMSGVCEVVSTKDVRKRYTAPHIFVSPGGTKRAMVAIEDLTWVTVHPTTETDLDKIEEELIIGEEA